MRGVRYTNRGTDGVRGGRTAFGKRKTHLKGDEKPRSTNGMRSGRNHRCQLNALKTAAVSRGSEASRCPIPTLPPQLSTALRGSPAVLRGEFVARVLPTCLVRARRQGWLRFQLGRNKRKLAATGSFARSHQPPRRRR